LTNGIECGKINHKIKQKERKGECVMNKKDLIDFVAEEMGVTKKESKMAVDVVIDGLTAGLLADGKVTLVGFGVFEVVKRNARTARNPQTGEAVEVPEKFVPKFRASNTLKAAVVGGDYTPVEDVDVADEVDA